MIKAQVLEEPYICRGSVLLSPVEQYHATKYQSFSPVTNGIGYSIRILINVFILAVQEECWGVVFQ